MVEETAGDCPGLERTVYLGTPDWQALIDQGADLPEDAVAQRMATLDTYDLGPVKARARAAAGIV